MVVYNNNIHKSTGSLYAGGPIRERVLFVPGKFGVKQRTPPSSAAVIFVYNIHIIYNVERTRYYREKEYIYIHTLYGNNLRVERRGKNK